MLDNKDIRRRGAMIKETEKIWDVSDETKRLWEEIDKRIRKSKEIYIDRARKLGASLDVTLIAITGLPPGIDSDPAVYRSNHNGSYFMVAGKKGEVATYDDPEEVQERAKIKFSVPLNYVGEYAIVKIDLDRKIKDGIPFYTPAGYIEKKRFNPETDPPIISNQGNAIPPAI